MRVIKKINNNAAVCQDNNKQELIALGKGIGFPKTPYELTDLSKIDMTFYRVSSQTVAMLSTISDDVITVSAEIVKFAQESSENNFSSNVVFSLADHINFAIERIKKNQFFDFSLSYDIEHMYREEFKLGLKSLKLIKEQLGVKLPKAEATAIAMHFINAREIPVKNITESLNNNILSLVINIIETEFSLKIDQTGFAFNRFKVHLQYFIQRLQENKQINGEISNKLVEDLISSDPKVYQCGKDLVIAIDNQLHTKTTDDEMFYLMIYIKRMISKTINDNKEGKRNE